MGACRKAHPQAESTVCARSGAWNAKEIHAHRPFHLEKQAKTAPALIDADRRHLQRIAAELDGQRADVARRLDDVRRVRAGSRGAAVDRDLEIRRLSSRLRVLERFDIDVCLGRMTPPTASPSTSAAPGSPPPTAPGC